MGRSSIDVMHYIEWGDVPAVRSGGSLEDPVIGQHPLAQVPTATAGEPPLCVTTTPDRAGRLADRSPLRHLGWSRQTVTRFDVQSNTMVVVTADGSTSSITSQGHLQLPLAVRRRCRIEAGARLLIVAWTDTGRLVICTAAAVEGMVLAELSVLGARAGGRW